MAGILGTLLEKRKLSDNTGKMPDGKLYPNDRECWEYENYSVLFAEGGSLTSITLDRDAAQGLLWDNNIFQLNKVDLVQMLLARGTDFEVKSMGRH